MSMTSPDSQSESADKYIFEPLLWSLIPALLPTVLGEFSGGELKNTRRTPSEGY